MGHMFIGPVVGRLKEGESGLGRMTKPEDVFKTLEDYLLAPKGDRVLIVNGASKVYLDPIRYITNSSTGTMGKMLSNALHLRGYQVEILEVGNYSNQELLDIILTKKFDIYISVAAIADFTFNQQAEKIHKGESLSLEIKSNIDVLTQVKKNFPHAKYVGFKHDNDKEKAINKLKKAGLDLMVWNRLGSMGREVIEGSIIFSNGQEKSFQTSKIELAEIMDFGKTEILER